MDVKYIELSVNGESMAKCQIAEGSSITTVVDKYQVFSHIEKDKIIFNISDISKSNCSICGHSRIKIKGNIGNVYLCPGLEGSPMHRFGPISADDTIEEQTKRFKKFLNEKGCTLNEYRKARNRIE